MMVREKIFTNGKRLSILLFLSFISCFASLPVSAQSDVTITVIDSASGVPMVSALVVQDGKAIGVTDLDGKYIAKINTSSLFVFRYAGYFNRTVQIHATDIAVAVKMVSLNPELEPVTISSTRTNSRIEDTPTKIEVLGQEETGEENGIKPGNVASLLGDLSSIQLQSTAAVSGQSTVRIQGLDGRYTQMLRDGLPVYDGFAGGFGVLQLPPLDLKQIELMKGPASTLYGGGAIGGLVNFVSRTPSDSNDFSATVNVSSTMEQNVNLWNSNTKGKSGYTAFVQGTHAAKTDVNGDGFSDLPEVMQLVGHARFFFDPSEKNSFVFGIEDSDDDRSGGDMLVPADHSDTLHRFFEENIIQRTTGEFLFHHSFTDSSAFDIKASSTYFMRKMNSENGEFNGTQLLNYAEMTRLWCSSKQDLVIGTNIFFTHFSQDAPVINNTSLVIDQKTIGVFAQHTYRIAKKIAIESGVRGDIFMENGNSKQFFLPRIAVLWKWNERTGMRMSAGMGYKTANVLTLVPDEHQLPLYHFGKTDSLVAEHSYGGTVDVYWRRLIGKETGLYLNQSFFFTQVDHPVLSFTDSRHSITFLNASKPLMTYGSDSYVRIANEEFELYLGYTWTNALRTYDGINEHIPITPVHRISFVATKTLGEHFRTGIEGSWLSAQYRDDGTLTHPYFFGALMIACEVEHFTFVLNGEDVLNVLQSDFEPLYTGSIAAPQFSPIWAPVDGRVINFSVRFKL